MDTAKQADSNIHSVPEQIFRTHVVYNAELLANKTSLPHSSRRVVVREVAVVSKTAQEEGRTQ